MLADQNGRSAIHVSDQELLQARDDLIRRENPGPTDTDRAIAIRANWPLEKLTREHAEVWSNGKVLTVVARTGFGIALIPGAREIDLPPDTDDATLGAAVNEALTYSRELSLHDWYRHPRSSREETAAHYRDWRDSLMRRHGYKTQRALFTDMLHVIVVRHGEVLEYEPSNHVKLDAWSGDGIAPDSNVLVAGNSSAAAVGAALRLTLSRCLDTYRK